MQLWAFTVGRRLSQRLDQIEKQALEPDISVVAKWLVC